MEQPADDKANGIVFAFAAASMNLQDDGIIEAINQEIDKRVAQDPSEKIALSEEDMERANSDPYYEMAFSIGGIQFSIRLLYKLAKMRGWLEVFRMCPVGLLIMNRVMRWLTLRPRGGFREYGTLTPVTYYRIFSLDSFTRWNLVDYRDLTWDYIQPFHIQFDGFGDIFNVWDVSYFRSKMEHPLPMENVLKEEEDDELTAVELLQYLSQPYRSQIEALRKKALK